MENKTTINRLLQEIEEDCYNVNVPSYIEIHMICFGFWRDPNEYLVSVDGDMLHTRHYSGCIDDLRRISRVMARKISIAHKPFCNEYICYNALDGKI